MENNNYQSSAAVQELQELPQPHPFIKGTPRKNKKSRFTLQRVCQEETDHLVEDKLLLKVEDLCPRCCHLSARLVLVDAHFVLDACSMGRVRQSVC